MPIYDYLCSSCGQTTEVIHGIDAPAPRFCPACGAEGTLRKALTAPTVLFKGSGWAKKDRSSASASRAKAGSTSSSSDAPDGGSKTSGSESKSAADDSAKASKTASAAED